MKEEDRRLQPNAATYPAERIPVATNAPPNGVCASDTTFEALYSAYRPLLRTIALRKFNIPRADVDMLVHDVFTTYLAQQDRVREIHPYLVGGICNAARDYWRKKDKERGIFCDAETCPAATDDALLNSVIETLLVRSALGTLGSSCRDALHRFYVVGETATAIAESRGTTQGSILRLLHYCRDRARAAYRALCEEH
jgi:RNA polymerase sigma factor (sigma-70 family)